MDKNTQNFYHDILPPTGSMFFYYMDAGRLRERHTDNIPDLLKYLDALSGANVDTYFATGTTNTHHRQKGHGVMRKCYHMDIDCGEGKPYADHGDALLALQVAMSSWMPVPSYIVNSGGGLHLYWTLASPIEEKVWQVAANELKQKCKDHGFHADHGITGDPVRIMRAPGTMNMKTGEARPCKILKATDKVYQGSTFFRDTTFDPNMNTGPVPPLMWEEVDTSDPVYMRQIIKGGCKVMQKSFMEGGANDGYMTWRNIVGIASVCEDGEKFVHLMSHKHSNYNPENTDRMYAAAKASDKPLHIHCETFGDEYQCGKICATCPHKGNITSPTGLGYKEVTTQQAPTTTQQHDHAPEVTYPKPTPPFPYIIESNGNIAKSVPDGADEAGNPKYKPMYIYKGTTKLVHFGLAANVKNIHMNHLVFECSDGSVYEGIIETSKLASMPDLRDCCAELNFHPQHLKEFTDMMRSWSDALGATRGKSQKHYGWRDRHLQEFGVDDLLYKSDGTVERNIAMINSTEEYTPTGEFSDWQEKANACINDRIESAIVIASALAAPLSPMVSDPGCVMSVVGQSGVGKSTVMKVAWSLWGDPKSGIVTMNDTHNAIGGKLGVLRNLPAYWDEVRGKDAEENLIQTLFRLSLGREKLRMTQTADLREIKEWETIMVVGSNHSSLNTAARLVKDSEAGSLRMFEIEMPPVVKESEIDLRCTHCYGTAAHILAAHLVKHRDDYERLVDDIERKTKTKVNATPEERFRVSLVAQLVAGAMLGKAALGLEFDHKQLHTYLMATMMKLRNVGKQLNKEFSVESMVIQYVIQHQPETLITDTFPKGRGRHSIKVVKPPVANRGVMVHRTEDGELIVPKVEFEAFCETHDVRPNKVEQDMAKLGVKVDQASFGKGFIQKPTRPTCYIIDTTTAAWATHFNDEVVVQATNVVSIGGDE